MTSGASTRRSSSSAAGGLPALFEQDTLSVARGLLGSRLVRSDEHGRRTGRIVEVEAYLGPDDQAAHSRFGQTARSRPMYGRAGSAYVYLVYGMYRCLNVVTGPAGTPHAILIRAVEPIDGIEQIRAARLAADARTHRVFGPVERERAQRRLERTPPARLASGPGLVGAAFDVELGLTGTDLLDPTAALHLEARPAAEPPVEVQATPRIGIAFAGPPWSDEPWRFSIAGHPSVSG
jgi:DNA-3-methyladenine glycosylase